jgi:hypothetical protein
MQGGFIMFARTEEVGNGKPQCDREEGGSNQEAPCFRSPKSRRRYHMLTPFTFGYWGWGNATCQLLRAIDTAERKRGFSPPIFFDIRLKRNVRAEGFRGDAFEQLVPKGRYRWFPRLGNARIATAEDGIKIADPFSSRLLLEEALVYAKRNRRVIFFCACEFPCSCRRSCHRQKVTEFLLEDAERSGHRIKITEWPGGAPKRKKVKVTEAIYREVCGSRKSVPLPSRLLPRDLVGLPWGSIVDVMSGKESIPIISGPPKFQKKKNRWTLPIWEQHEPNTPTADLRRASKEWLKSNGIRTIQSSSHPSKQRSPLKAISVRQPWAHAIIHLGKDVENRPWRRNYSGPLLIHASSYREPNPYDLLSESMTNPPPKSKLVLQRACPLS